MDLKEFHLFARLPYDLRLQIWTLTIAPRSNTFIIPAYQTPPSILAINQESRAIALKHFYYADCKASFVNTTYPITAAAICSCLAPEVSSLLLEYTDACSRSLMEYLRRWIGIIRDGVFPRLRELVVLMHYFKYAEVRQSERPRVLRSGRCLLPSAGRLLEENLAWIAGQMVGEMRGMKVLEGELGLLRVLSLRMEICDKCFHLSEQSMLPEKACWKPT